MKEKSEMFESEHPPPIKIDKKEKIHVPGAKSLRIVFDVQSDLRRNCDYLQFFMDEKQKEKLTEKLDKNGDSTSFPKEDLVVDGDTIYYWFHSDNCRFRQFHLVFFIFYY